MRAWLAQPVSFGAALLMLFMLGATFGVGAAFGIRAAIDAHDAKTAATRQQEGRTVAIDVLCGGLVGVEEAGKKALTGRLAGQDPRGSLPTSAIREYNATISRRVLLQAGVDARGVVQDDGTLDCDALRTAAKAAGP